MRGILIALILGFVLTGCGSRKRTVYAPPTPPVERVAPEKVAAAVAEGIYLLPEDTGNFIHFPINTIEEYIAAFSEIAQFEMKAYGIPASITLAQGILESGYGRGALTLKTNNHFGIKCHSGWQGQYDHHDDDEIGECFRKYNHPMYSFRDHSIFLSGRARYASLFELRRDDYKGWARGLKEAGYATDRQYPQKLINFIEQYELHRYDKVVLSGGYPVQPVPKEYDFRVHIVEQGDTLYSISKRYFVSINELMQLNRMNDSKLSVGQEIMVKQQKIN